MSVSSISGYSQYQTSSGQQQRKQEFDALKDALQSGDLTAAQQAFSTMQQHSPDAAQSASGGSAHGNGNEAVITDISALGKALSSGDVDSAQSAFATLRSDMRSAPPPPSPRAAQADGSDGSDTDDTDATQSLFEQLAEALKSGVVDTAKSVFETLQELTGTDSSKAAAASNPFADDLSAIGDALNDGDLETAQSAFAQLQDHMKNTPPPPRGSGDDKVQEAFGDLADALQNGDLDTAQSAFATLQDLAPKNQADGGDLGSDFSALSAALQSGSLDDAQSLFQSLLEDLQANTPKHPGMQQYTQNSGDSTSSNVSVST